MVRAAALAVCLIAGAGCARTWASFEPYSAGETSEPPVVSRAVLAYEGDIDALAAAGAQIVGKLEVDGNGYASSGNVRDRALVEAARHGATHILIAGEDSSTEWAQVTRDRSTTTFYGNTAQTTYTPGARVPITFHSGTFVILRVAPERWRDLPAALQPVAGRDVAVWPQAALTVTGPPSQVASRTATPSGNWFCSANANPLLGFCFRSGADCEGLVQKLGGYGYAPCAAAASAVCFAGASIGLSCHPSADACHAARDASFAKGDTIVHECVESE